MLFIYATGIQYLRADTVGPTRSLLSVNYCHSEKGKKEKFREGLLFKSVIAGRDDITSMLLGKGVNPNCRNERLQTPLHFAAFQNDYKAARILLENGARPDYADADGMSPLHFAAEAGSAAIVRLLINRGAAVNSSNSNGATPLHYAAYRNRAAAGLELLKSGGNPYMRDLSGRSPIDHAEVLGCNQFKTAVCKSKKRWELQVQKKW